MPYTGNSIVGKGGGHIGQKTVVYLDVLLLVNFLSSYFLLMAAGALGAARASFGRMLAASALAAVSALVLLVPQAPYPAQVAYKIGTGCAVGAAAFGLKPLRRWATVSCWFAALNIALAGLAMLVVLKTGTNLVKTENLTVYLRISPLLLVGCAGACCLAVEVGLRLFGHTMQAPTAGVELSLCGTVVHLRAALDTGCHLKDPITCLPVLLISYPDAASRLPAALADYVQAWFAGQRRQTLPPGLTLRVIPCTTVSDTGLLPGFAVGNICIISPRGPQPLGRSTVAFAPQSFGSDRYEALYGIDFL